MPDSAPFDLLVRNGTVVSAEGRRQADVGIRDGVFVEIGAQDELGSSAIDELDASGLFVLPGLIDSHVHFREPGLTHEEDWLTGSRAAVMGGITTVLDMPNTIPPTDSPAAVEEKLRLADEKSFCDFGVFGLLSDDNADRLPELADHPSVVGLKVFLGPTTGDLQPPSDARLLRGLATAAESGLRVAFHAEDARIVGARRDRPIEAEVAAIEHVGRLLLGTGAVGHVCHVSSAAGLGALVGLRSRGVDLTAEVTPHHCFLTPIRGARDGADLLAGLASRDIDLVASDHAPHTPDEKRAADISDVPAGIAGVETSLELCLA